MKRNNIIIIVMLTICFIVVGCRNRDDTIKIIDANDFTISYSKSIYEAKGKVEQETIDNIIEYYNNIKLNGSTNQEINYDKAITIIFIDNDKISGKITVDDKGICGIDNNNYIIDKESNIYEDLLKVYHDLKGK